MWLPGIRMPARRCDVNRIKSAKLRAFLRYSGWVRAPLPRNEVLVGYLPVGADHQLEEGAR